MTRRRPGHACALIALFLFGCHHEHAHPVGEESPHGGEHSHDHDEATEHSDHDHGGADHGHDHDDSARSTEVVTLWGETTQLFVEFAPLVVGEDSEFAVHLTELSDHRAIDSGTLTVELRSPEHTTERFGVAEPSTAGIFRPILRPEHAGLRTVVVHLDAPMAAETHTIGDVRVFATRDEADADAMNDSVDPGDEIVLLLEDQWRMPFGVERVATRTLRPSVRAFGLTALPDGSESVVAAPVDGHLSVAGTWMRVGDSLVAGSPLFSVTTGPQGSADPAALDLEAEQAAIRVEAAQREVERVDTLADQGVVAPRRLDEARTALAIAQAELRSAERRRERFGASPRSSRGGYTVDVSSPRSGVVTAVLATPETWVPAGAPVIHVVDRDRLWLDVGLPEYYVGRLREISGVWFEIDGFDRVFELSGSDFVSLSHTIDPITRTLSVRFALDNSDRELVAGLTTDAHLIVDAPFDAVAVPADAVLDDAGVSIVYVQRSGESFERRPVRLGLQDGDFVEVREGLEAGEWIVVRGGYAVRLASTQTDAIGHGHAH